MTGLNERWTTVGGRTVRYLVGGQGKPLVLCHGFLSSAEEFGGRFSALMAERTLIVPDLPGNASSAPLPGRHTVDAIAACVDELLAQFGVVEFDLGGLCLGASVAAALARRRPASVGRLVLHTPLIAPGLVRARYRYQWRLLTLPGPWGVVRWARDKRRISDLYKKFVIREGPIDSVTSDINFENQRRADPAAARDWLLDALARDDLSLLAERTEPTLIIVVRNDTLVNVEGVQRLVEGLPNVTLFIDEEGGHGWSETAVRRHLAVLQRFFAAPSAVSSALESAAASGEAHQDP